MPLSMEVGVGAGDVVIDGVPSLPKCGTASNPPVVYCGQTAGWMKMPLGTEVDLGPCHIVSEGTLFPTRAYCGHGRPSQLLLSFCIFSIPSQEIVLEGASPE